MSPLLTIAQFVTLAQVQSGTVMPRDVRLTLNTVYSALARLSLLDPELFIRAVDENPVEQAHFCGPLVETCLDERSVS